MTVPAKIKNKSSAHGGRRIGAGRPQGAKGRATLQAKATLSELAREHTDLALSVLAEVARNGASDSAKVAAANALLDRGYGKPPQAIEHSGDLPGFYPMADLTDEQLEALEAIGRDT